MIVKITQGNSHTIIDKVTTYTAFGDHLAEFDKRHAGGRTLDLRDNPEPNEKNQTTWGSLLLERTQGEPRIWVLYNHTAYVMTDDGKTFDTIPARTYGTKDTDTE